MLQDILDDDHLQWHPLLIRHYTNFWLYYWSGPYYQIWLFTLLREVTHRTFATGAACQQRTLTPPDTWSCPTLGLASGLMLRPISPELVLFPDFWVSNIPRYFCFCLASETTGEDCSSTRLCTTFGAICNVVTGQCVCDCNRKLVTAMDAANRDQTLCAPGESQVLRLYMLIDIEIVNLSWMRLQKIKIPLDLCDGSVSPKRKLSSLKIIYEIKYYCYYTPRPWILIV